MRKNQIIQDDLKEIASHPLPWDVFKGKTVVITGAAGFLPAYLVETLLYLNELYSNFQVRVIGLVRNLNSAQKRFKYYSNRQDLTLIQHDVSLPWTTDGPVDFIIHAASQASPKYYGTDPVGTLSPNIFGTHSLLQLAQKKKSEGFLFFSSGEVYGQVDPSRIPITENDYGYIDPTQIRSSYAESKRMGETLCVSWCHQFQVPTKIVRPFHTYGPGMKLDDGRVFSDFVSNVVHGQNIVMKSDGSAIRPFCYLADATKGFFTILLKGKNGEAYNIGNDQAESSIKDLAKTLVGLFPEKGLKVIQDQKDRGKSYLQSPIVRNCPNIEKARQLGWEPRISIPEGFSRTVRSFE